MDEARRWCIRVTDAVRVRVFVSGVVQGVCFRWEARRAAERLGVDGWVRNLADGRVEAVAAGPPDAVEGFVDWCGEGPAAASVSRVDRLDEDPGGLAGFEIRPSA